MTIPVHDLRSEELQAAAHVLAQAFRGDPMFRYIYGSDEHYDRTAEWMFTTWARWAMLYGKAWTTPNVEAVALRRVPGKYRMSLWSLLRAGMFSTPRKLGSVSYGRFDRLLKLLEARHHAIMGDAPHWYCQNIATLPEQQGKGFGKALMEHTFRQADSAGLPCYLETAAAKSLAIHLKHGYEIRETLHTPDGGLTMYLMTRPPHR